VLSENKDMGNKWDAMTTTYVATLDHWKNSYMQWQDLGKKALESYTQSIEKANKEGNTEMMKKLTDLWSETWNMVGKDNSNEWYLKSWENIWKNSGFVTSNAFNDYWQEIWQNSSEEFFKRSNEAMKKMNNF